MAKQRAKQSVEPAGDDKLNRIRSGVNNGESRKNPLTQEHLRMLNEILRECAETERMCCACDDAGIDIEQERVVNAEQRKLAEALKKHFFPHSP